MRSILLIFLFTSVTFGQQLHGKVVSVAESAQNRYITNSEGQHGINVRSRVQVYRVETADRFYLLEGTHHRELEPGSELDFRLEKGRARLSIGGKDKKWRIVGEGLLPKP